MIPARRSAGLRRSIALLLFAVFLGAGTTLPGADALLFHGEKAAAEHRAHVEPAGGCGSHADSCTLGRTASGTGAALAGPAVVRAAPTAALPVASAPASLLTAGAPGGSPQPRAPPVPVA
jgi:hypothetical protein